MSLLAVVSPMLAILGFWTFLLGSLFGLIVGIIAAIRIRRSGGRLTGSNWANTGIAVSLVILVFFALALAPVIASMPSAADVRNSRSLMFLGEVGSAFSSYMNDHDGTLPSADNWTDAVEEYAVHPATGLRGHLDVFLTLDDKPEDGRAYAMNILLDAMRLSDVTQPGRTVLLFEVNPGSPLAGGPMMLPRKPRHRDGYVIVFVNGTSRNVPAEQIHESLVWVP